MVEKLIKINKKSYKSRLVFLICSFFTLKKLIKDTWTTRVDTTFDFDKGVTFSGFYGTYEGVVKVDGTSYPFRFEHKKEADKPIRITLSK